MSRTSGSRITLGLCEERALSGILNTLKSIQRLIPIVWDTDK
jgi:hypothetical protein